MSVSVLLVGTSALKRDMLCNEFDRAGFSVWTAANASKALQILQGEAIQVLLMAASLPEISLPEWILQLEAQAPHLRIMLLADPQTPEIASWLRSRGVGLFSAHSYDLNRLRCRLEEQVRLPKGRSFHFSNINLFDLMQLLSLSLRKIHLYIAQPETACEGLLYFSQGQVRHAVFGELHGEEAFYAVMNLYRGYFAEAELGRPEYYTIETQMNRLMATSAQRLDQSTSFTAPEKVQTFAGELKDLSLLDVLQVLGTSHQSCEIQVLDLFRGDGGRIQLAAGDVTFASFGAQQGLKALEQMVDIRTGQFNLQSPQNLYEANLDLPLTALILHLGQYQDESRQHMDRLPKDWPQMASAL